MWKRSILCLALGAGCDPVVAQSLFEYDGSIETGWTSNASDSVDGGADVFATHNHQLTFSFGSDAAALRGSLGFNQTVFAVTQYENDVGVEAHAGADFALQPGLVLRVGYGVTRSWNGDEMDVADVTVATVTDRIEHEAALEVVAAGPDQKATLGVNWRGVDPGETRLMGVQSAPLRLAANVGLAHWYGEWEKALGTDWAVLAGVSASMAAVPVADQIVYQRVPAQARQAGFGLRWQGDRLGIEGRLGVDLVWPAERYDLARMFPDYGLTVSAQPWDDISISASLESGLELAEPVDGVASRTDTLSLEASKAIAEDTTLFGQAGWSREEGLFADARTIQKTVTLGARRDLGEAGSLQVSGTLARVEQTDQGYDKASVNVSFSTSL